MTRVQHTSLCESVTTRNCGKLQAFLLLKKVAQLVAVNVLKGKVENQRGVMNRLFALPTTAHFSRHQHLFQL